MKFAINKRELSILQFPFLLLVCSWLRLYTTESYMVDNHPISPYNLRIICFLFLVISFLYSQKAVYQILFSAGKDALNFNYRLLGYTAIVLSFFTLPFLSNDFFSLIGYSDAWLNGYDIYKNFNAVSQTEFAKYINPSYFHLNCKYGPINVLLMNISVYLGKGDLVCVFWISKIIYLVFAVGYLKLSLFLLGESKEKFAPLLLFPIWYIQGLGQFHNDIVGVFFLVLSYTSLYRKKWFWSCAFVSLSALTKFTFIVFLPLPILYYLDRVERIEFKFLLKLGIYLLFSLLILGIASYFPFIHHWKDILEPISAMNTERPSSTFSDIASYAWLLHNSNFEENYHLMIPIFKKLGLVLFLFSIFRYLTAKKRYTTNHHSTLLLQIFCILIFVYSHRFLPWYLMVFPLLIYHNHRESWLKWFFFIFIASFFQDLALVINTDNLLGQIVMAGSTIMTVGLFFYKIKERFQFHEN